MLYFFETVARRILQFYSICAPAAGLVVHILHIVLNLFFFFFSSFCWTQAQYYGGYTNHSPFAPLQQGPAMRFLNFFFWFFFKLRHSSTDNTEDLHYLWWICAVSSKGLLYAYFTNFFVLKKINSVLWRKLPLWSTCASSAGPCYPYFNNFFVQIFPDFW